MRHLSLANLTALRTAFASSTTPIDLSIIKRVAVHVVSRMIAFDKCVPRPIFSDIGPYYKFRRTHPHTGDRYPMVTWWTSSIFVERKMMSARIHGAERSKRIVRRSKRIHKNGHARMNCQVESLNSLFAGLLTKSPLDNSKTLLRLSR